MPPVDPVSSSVKSLQEIQFQSERDRWLENWMHVFRLKELGHKSAIDYGMFGLKTLVFSHGGALVALITFLQTIWKDKDAYQQDAAQALSFFGVGISVALLAILFSYVAMSYFALIFEEEHTKKYSKKYERFRVAALSAAALSLACFVGGLCTVHAMLDKPSELHSTPPGLEPKNHNKAK